LRKDDKRAPPKTEIIYVCHVSKIGGGEKKKDGGTRGKEIGQETTTRGEERRDE